MKLTLNKNRGQRAVVVFLVILVLVLTMVFIGAIAYVMIKAIHKIKTPPPEEPGGWKHPPPIGSWYSGGWVRAYGGAPSANRDEIPPIESAPPGFIMDYVDIYAGDSPENMTNLIISVGFSDIDSVIGPNGLPLENWPDGQKPARRFYNVVARGH